MKEDLRSSEREVFLRALELPAGPRRTAFLEAACAGIPALRNAVEALLAHDVEDGFLQGQAGQLAEKARMLAAAGEPAEAGSRIGAYKLLEKIGEGGCGVVYMAEQEKPVRRRVALKVIKLGMDTRSVIARFEAERQALAMMDHPNIARVFEAGSTESGRPYFVMELVRGVRITEFCDRNELSTEERLRLFTQVCDAIQHAHQKGIIHRDIKPSNILVTLHDGVPAPKVIDFGIAKAIDQRLTDKTLFTAFQVFIGTPAYTSPEQAEMSGLDVDTRGDIYSLGVLLYELLTGQTPLDADTLSKASLDEMRRLIREEDPPMPSTRISTMGVGASEMFARSRRSKPPALLQEIRGDLDWVVMKCLEKDRTRRYATVNGLASDIGRVLRNEPIAARPPSKVYRLRKFIRRNRVVVSAAAALSMALLLGAVVSGWQAVRATRAEREQKRLRQAAELAQASEAVQLKIAREERLMALRQAYNSDMNLVQQALGAHNFGRAVNLLNRHRPKAGELDLRQWEWRFFWQQSRSEAAFALPKSPERIRSLALSPNGRLLVSFDDRGEAKLWDLAARKELAIITPRGAQNGPAFSHNGAKVALSMSRGPGRSALRVWNVAAREFSEAARAGSISSFAFAQDDESLFLAGTDGILPAWDLRPAEEFREENFRGPGIWRREGVLSADGKLAAFGEENGQVRIVGADGKRIMIKAFPDPVAAMLFSPNGTSLAVSPSFRGGSTSIKLFSTQTGVLTSELRGHFSWIPALAFFPNGERLASGGADQTVRVWDLKTGSEAATFRGHLSEVSSVAVTADGARVVSGCKDGNIFVWDAKRAGKRKSYRVLPEAVSALEFLPQDGRMIAAAQDGRVKVWNRGLQPVETIDFPTRNISSLKVSTNGAKVYAATRRGSIYVMDWATRLVSTNLSPEARREPPSALFLQGDRLASVNPFSGVRVWNAETTSLVTRWENTGGPGMFGVSAGLSPDGSLFASLARSGGIDLRDTTSGKWIGTIPTQMGPGQVAFSPDGQLLATASADGNLALHDLKKLVTLDTLRGHLLGAHSLAFSSDGQRLASCSHGNEAVKIWDVPTRHELATLAGEPTLYHSVKFSPDGALVVAITGQGQACIWEAPSPGEIAELEAGPNL